MRSASIFIYLAVRRWIELLSKMSSLSEHQTFSMVELAESTATGSLPMYTLILLYHYSPYVVGVLLLIGLVVSVTVYFSMSSRRLARDRKDW